MGESTGRIFFINSHDYVSDVTGTDVVGCLASLMTEAGSPVDVYTQSLRLQHTLEMAYTSGRKVTIDYADKHMVVTEKRRQPAESLAAEPADSFEGPFNLRAIWTVE